MALFLQPKVQKIQRQLTALNEKLDQYISNKKSGFVLPLNGFRSLSPTVDAEKSDSYLSTLYWALKNRKSEDIKNLALTGPYGSGKSSILRTFQKRNIDPDLCFLNISLATFKDELPAPVGGNEEDTVNGNSWAKTIRTDRDTLRIIELSILQQIFYHEEDHKIPESRFARIESTQPSTRKKFLSTLIIFLIGLAHLIFPDQLSRQLRVPIKGNLEQWLHNISLIVTTISFGWLIHHLIKNFSQWRISKLSISDTEIEVDNNISKSVLNSHLDEILYFFEVTKYTVVVFEDLDRFQQTEIFTKLRELNLLINNSEKIKRDIVFIYAVRDDMFQDKDRTKFFDFIIPVIPVINSSNSNEKLLKLIKENGYPVSEDVIEDVSLFVDDLRLLYNIVNEYGLYKTTLDSQGLLNPDKLFAMIIYKNIFPRDFVDLGDQKGILFNVFEEKNQKIKELVAANDKHIQELKQEISFLETVAFRSADELRAVYVIEYASKLPEFRHFIIDGSQVSLKDAAKEDKFERLRNRSAQYYNNNSGRRDVNLSFSTIENNVDAEMSYDERLQKVNDVAAHKIQTLKQKIEENERENIQIKHYKIAQLLEVGALSIDIGDNLQNSLINILVRSSYIDENYLDYFTIFYEGSITKEDRQFLLNVKSTIATDFRHKLNRIEKLVEKIQLVDFRRDYILNFSLLDFLLNDTNYEDRLVAILDLIARHKPSAVAFMEQFVDESVHADIFIKKLSAHWIGFWNYISKESLFSEGRKETYLQLLLANAELRDLEVQAGNSSLRQEISEKNDFLQIAISEERMKSIIETLKIKFRNVNLEGIPSSLLDYIYDNNAYYVNIKMIQSMMKFKGYYEQREFDTKNFFSIRHSGASKLIDYVQADIQNYVKQTYLKIPTNTQEDECSLTELLNDQMIDFPDRLAIIQRSATSISNIADIKDRSLWEPLLQYQKIQPEWNNLIQYYDLTGKLDENLISFLNNESVYTALSKRAITVSGELLYPESKDYFFEDFIFNESITPEATEELIKAVPYKYGNPKFEDLSREKVNILIDGGIVLLTRDNFDMLKSKFPNIHLILALIWFDEFKERIGEFELDTKDVEGLIKAAISNDRKIQLINLIDKQLLIGNPSSLEEVATIAFENESLKMDIDLLEAVITSSGKINDRLILLTRDLEKFSNNQIAQILGKFEEPYSIIAEAGKIQYLSDTTINKTLLAGLKAVDFIKGFTADNNGLKVSTF